MTRLSNLDCNQSFFYKIQNTQWINPTDFVDRLCISLQLPRAEYGVCHETWHGCKPISNPFNLRQQTYLLIIFALFLSFLDPALDVKL